MNNIARIAAGNTTCVKEASSFACFVELNIKRGDKTMIVYCDGGCSKNGTPQQRGYGSYKIGDFPVVTKQFGCVTNNEAEYLALINALEACAEMGIQRPVIKSDSRLMVSQIKGDWKITGPHLRRLCNLARDRLSGVNGKLVWVSRNEIVPVLGH